MQFLYCCCTLTSEADVLFYVILIYRWRTSWGWSIRSHMTVSRWTAHVASSASILLTLSTVWLRAKVADTLTLTHTHWRNWLSSSLPSTKNYLTVLDEGSTGAIGHKSFQMSAYLNFGVRQSGGKNTLMQFDTMWVTQLTEVICFLFYQMDWLSTVGLHRSTSENRPTVVAKLPGNAAVCKAMSWLAHIYAPFTAHTLHIFSAKCLCP